MLTRGAERFLRIALFSDVVDGQFQPELRISPFNPPLNDRRRDIAQSLRERRRKGVVPVFISLGWFLFSLGLSIQTSFARLGDNQTAHDLALGLLLAWLPVFVIGTIVDRNAIGVDPIREKLNKFLEEVRVQLRDPDKRELYLANSGKSELDLTWTTDFETRTFTRQGFFTDFAGQGRLHWHYGVAHPILAGMENADIAERGRNWLQDSSNANETMVWGEPHDRGLYWFDFRMIWQMLGATVVVGGTIFGAFILSCKSSILSSSTRS
ncbi:MAG: hypothetical protein Q9220_002162 [cf. Caloplaca sp. 1 TL-2023]